MRSSNEEIYLSMGISKTVYDYGCTIEKSLRDRFDEVDSLSLIHISEPTRPY